MKGDDCKADTGNPPTNSRCRGLELLPGDVIYLRRWWPSVEKREYSGLHWTGPASFVDRVPLRIVDPTTGTLYPHERELLANVLTVHRSAEFNELNPADSATLIHLRDALLAHENVLWNSLVGGLRVRALDVAPRRKDEADPDSPPENFVSRDPNLYLTYRVDRLCNELKSAGVHGFFRCEVLLDDDGSASDFVETELFAREMPYPSPWDAFLGERDGIVTERNSQYYADQSSGGATRRANVATDSDDTWPDRSEAVATLPNPPDEPTEADEQPVDDDVSGALRAELNVLTRRLDAAADTIDHLTGRLTGFQNDMAAITARRLAAPWATFNFVEVELSGTSILAPGDAERRWSLKDWDESGICRLDGVDARIERLVLRKSRLPIQIVSSKPTDRLTLQVEPDGTVTRRLIVKKDACTACVLIHSIHRSELQWLRPSDVAGVYWSYVDAKNRRHVAPSAECARR